MKSGIQESLNEPVTDLRPEIVEPHALSFPTPLKWLGVIVLVLCLAYAKPIYAWAQFAWHSSLYSHVLLIPIVSLYFVWKRRPQFVAAEPIIPSPQHSTTPPLHHSNTPTPHHSVTPTPHHFTTPSLHHSTTPTPHHSNTPTPHHSNTPTPHHSNTPSLHHPTTPPLQIGFRPELQGARKLALLPLCLGFALLTVYWMRVLSGGSFAREDALCLWVLSWLGFLYSACIGLLGLRNFRRFLFPALFLLFAAPFPTVALDHIETFLQHGSSWAADVMFRVSGMPFLRDGTLFQLPGIPINVAPECSGIHSSLVLFITSILAGQVFLKARWSRWLLALAVIPLALLRNGFRVFTIGQLAVHIGPQVLDSFIHRRGGPIFFVLSLVPFFLLLFWLVRKEKLKAKG